MHRTVQWLNQNNYRKYPFVEDTVPMLSPGGALPDNFLLDFQLIDYTNRELETGTARTVSMVEFQTAGGELTITFQRSGATATYEIVIPVTAATPYDAGVTVTGSTHYHMRCVIGDGLADVVAAGSGDVTNADIEPALVQYQTRHRLTSVVGDSLTSVPVTGDIYFEEGYGVAVNVNNALDRIRLSAFPGAGAGLPCDGAATDGYVQIIADSFDTLPAGYVTVDGIDFIFGDPPPDVICPGSESGSWSGSESGSCSPYSYTYPVEAIPGDIIYVPYEDTAEETFQSLASWIATYVPGADVTYNYGEPGVAYIEVTRDNTLVENCWEDANTISMLRYPTVKLDCAQAILYINDVSPDGYGNMQLVGGKGIQIINDPDNNRIYVSNRLDPDSISCGKSEVGAPNA